MDDWCPEQFFLSVQNLIFNIGTDGRETVCPVIVHILESVGNQVHRVFIFSGVFFCIVRGDRGGRTGAFSGNCIPVSGDIIRKENGEGFRILTLFYLVFLTV